MRFASLGSGSRGNALVIESGQTRVLLDCGFSVREIAFRLGRLGLLPDSLSAILITHEHSDHVAGAFKLASRLQLAIRMTHGTFVALPARLKQVNGVDIHLIDSHQPFQIGDLLIQAFPVPHDAREPVQFVFSDGQHRFGMVTDLGHSTPHIEHMLSAIDALVLECNHDISMLRNGEYPLHLKKRISSALGHLDNVAASRLLAALDTSRLQHLIAAHLSQQNNSPALAQAALASVLGCAESWIGVAEQDEGFAWRDIL